MFPLMTSLSEKELARAGQLISAVAGRLYNFCSDPSDQDAAMRELENCVCPALLKRVYIKNKQAVLDEIESFRCR